MKKGILYLVFTILFAACCMLTEASGKNEINKAYGEGEPSGQIKISKMEYKLYQMINQQREKNGVKPLKFSEMAYKAAKFHSNDMAELGFFSHVSPDGKQIGDRLKKFGFKTMNRTWGENIAMNFNLPDPLKHAVDSWMNSEGHRKNILNPKFQYTGVAIEKDPDGKYYYTQVFWGKL